MKRKPIDRNARAERKTIDRALSRLGLCSRTEAVEFVRAGRVRVNGLVVRDPERWVVPERDRIELDREQAKERAKLYVALHKPVGYVTTRSDPEGRKTVYDLLGDLGAWLAPVGRLDRDTSGLLLFTNDTDFAARLLEPTSHVAKRYRVEARGRIDDTEFERLRRGVELSDGRTLPARVALLRRSKERTLFELTITEGRNRQVRRMLEAIDSKVLKLARVAFGSLELADLAPGAHRELLARERNALRR
ncbi:MAG: rRNA pseudouridine synthase [Planctomycetes bacterium]|nr:rRNA pseudouridine synthase [Planctomycetota bacterium]